MSSWRQASVWFSEESSDPKDSEPRQQAELSRSSLAHLRPDGLFSWILEAVNSPETQRWPCLYSPSRGVKTPPSSRPHEAPSTLLSGVPFRPGSPVPAHAEAPGPSTASYRHPPHLRAARWTVSAGGSPPCSVLPEAPTALARYELTRTQCLWHAGLCAAPHLIVTPHDHATGWMLISLAFLQMRKRRLRAANCPSQRDTAHRHLWTGQLNPRAFPFGHRATYPSPGPWLGALPTPGLTPASSPDPTLPPSMLCSNQTGLITASLTKREVGVCTASVHTPHPLVPEYNY